MIFGERFYPLLKKMAPWRQSLFALTLAQRQYAHILLWADLVGTETKARRFNWALRQLWIFHQDKFNHLNLEEIIDNLEPDLPEVGDNPNTGELFALDAALTLTAAYDAIVMHEGDEAEIASRASLGAAVRAAADNQDLSDDEIRNLPLVDAEVNFQAALMEKLMENRRDPKLTLDLIKLALDSGCSNIGLTLDELPDISEYELKGRRD